jgi:hypothetical protein
MVSYAISPFCVSSYIHDHVGDSDLQTSIKSSGGTHPVISLALGWRALAVHS